MANTTENANLCGLKRENFQTTINGKKTDLYILRNRKGYEVAISNYGGAIMAIMVPDKDGNVANVIQGHDSIEQLTSGNEPYLSTLIGRWGNRICKGQFILNGKEYQLALNDGPNHLHGGKKGFNAKVWEARQMGPRSLALHRVSSYGEEGYTGELDVTVEYTFTDNNELIIEYLATTNKKTIVNTTTYLIRRKRVSCHLLLASPILRADVRWSATPLSLACSSTLRTSLQVIRALTAVPSHVVRLYVWRLSTSPTLLTVLTSPLLSSILVSSISRRPFIALASRNNNSRAHSL